MSHNFSVEMAVNERVEAVLPLVWLEVQTQYRLHMFWGPVLVPLRQLNQSRFQPFNSSAETNTNIDTSLHISLLVKS
jgi:hypothetical protein